MSEATSGEMSQLVVYLGDLQMIRVTGDTVKKIPLLLPGFCNLSNGMSGGGVGGWGLCSSLMWAPVCTQSLCTGVHASRSRLKPLEYLLLSRFCKAVGVVLACSMGHFTALSVPGLELCKVGIWFRPSPLSAVTSTNCESS
jgi:hypothetical protein